MVSDICKDPDVAPQKHTNNGFILMTCGPCSACPLLAHYEYCCSASQRNVIVMPLTRFHPRSLAHPLALRPAGTRSTWRC